MQRLNLFILVVFLSAIAFILAGCENTGGVASGASNEIAATVNGKPIKMEDIEKLIKNQMKGEEAKLSPLELAQGRLQVLDQLIQQEVMYQKAEKEKQVPSDDDVTQEINKQKTQSGKSQEEFEKTLKDAGITEADLREQVKKQLGINKLIEKVTGAIEPPKDKEIEDFFNSSKDVFVNKRGAQFAAIVLDPTDSGQPNDKTKSPSDVQLVLREMIPRIKGDFATLAREYSEDPASAARGGDFRFFSEEEMKQTFSPAFADFVMKMNVGDIFPQPVPLEGKTLILKLQRKQEKDEALTLDKPEVRQQITDTLVNARKQLLSASYAAVAMNEARIENFLAKKVVANPNDLSGARPAVAPDANSNSAANANANTIANANANGANTAANTANKAATNANAANKANVANANANTK